MMRLELHDAAIGHRAGVRDIDYDYQAEMWVTETADQLEVVKWILFDDIGERCVWERKAGETGYPRITMRSDRWAGTWQDEPAA